MNSYKELQVWQQSIDLCEDIYKYTEGFPKSESYGMTSQIRRCAVSIPSNIAEGQRRGHLNEYIQFLRVSYASAAELETQLIIANRVNYLNGENFTILNNKLERILKMHNKLISTLSSKSKSNPLQPTT